MPLAKLGDIDIYYEVSGEYSGRPLMLIQGLGFQMIGWHAGFIRLLEDAGFRVIQFDNRDSGLSSQSTTPYELDDMVGDAVRLLDWLEIDRSNVMGASMGGMIAQQCAITYPSRFSSLCSIMSAPNSSFILNDPDVLAARRNIPFESREDAITHFIARERISGLRGFDEAYIRYFAECMIDRANTPEGTDRQEGAVRNAPDRSAGLRTLDLPASVIHGRDDKLIDFEGGIETARCIPRAEFHLYADMGHQLVPTLWPEYVSILSRLCV